MALPIPPEVREQSADNVRKEGKNIFYCFARELENGDTTLLYLENRERIKSSLMSRFTDERMSLCTWITQSGLIVGRMYRIDDGVDILTHDFDERVARYAEHLENQKKAEEEAAVEAAAQARRDARVAGRFVPSDDEDGS